MIDDAHASDADALAVAVSEINEAAALRAAAVADANVLVVAAKCGVRETWRLRMSCACGAVRAMVRAISEAFLLVSLSDRCVN